MANLRIISISVSDSSTIVATFSESLNENINTSNIEIVAQTPGVPNPNVLVVNIIGNTLTLTTQPLTPLAAYFITFASTLAQPFNSLNGDAAILNDSITNTQLILGPLDSANPIQQYMTNFLRENVYDLSSPSIVSKYIQGLSSVISEALYDIRQVGNENYLSFTVIDEAQTRGAGAFDRLNEEGAYEVLRVGLNRTNDPVSSITPIASFPNYPVSLQATNTIDTLTVGSDDKIGLFNLNTFTLNLSERFIIILNSITFLYSSSTSYTYSIEEYGYQILTSEYDPDFAFTYLQLSDSQIRLNDKILNDPLFSTNNIVSIQVSYQYKDTGKLIDPISLVVDTVIPSGREVLPPIENIFTLQHAPVVTNSDVIGTVGTMSFIDPNAIPGSNAPHPAFVSEIPFRLDYLPSIPGQYSVDYSTGNVYVFGASSSMDGTGPYPPLAIYFYRFVFRSEIDYVFDIDSLDLVSLPNGSLTTSQANIAYNYEQVLAQGVDYEGDVHIEVLSESIQNRLTALNSIQPLNFPVTDVFRIFNQTTGEIYSILRWTDTAIYFNYSKPPNIVDRSGERASFQDVLNELLFVSATSPNSSNTIFKMFLSNNNIMAATQDCIGSSINSTATFSNGSIFYQEIYFDPELSEEVNNSRLNVIGNYQVDYINGIVWCLVSSTQSLSIGTISYKRGYIAPQNPHIITVDNIYYRSSVLTQITKTFSYTNFSDDSILPTSFDVSNESFFMGNPGMPYQVLDGQVGEFIDATFTNGVTNSIKFVRGLYEHTDLLNNTLPINFSPATTSNGMTISIAPLRYEEYHTVQFDGANYYVFANTDLLYQSPNITTTISVIRLSDSKQLWNNSGDIVIGTPFKLVLPGINSPNTGDAILLTYSYTIADLSRVVVDYNKGDYYVDYSYLADEIIISYEYGDNVLDFRQSSALNTGDSYYVSYKVGALRDALLANFGTLINIPILNDLDVSFERERYRDALTAALQSFTAGPTVASMSNIVNTIVHTPPKITESAFTNWSLGSSLLNPEPIATTGSFALKPVKYGNGVTMDTIGQTIKFPVVSNLRLEQGSFETWVMPEWSGIDNQSDITITIYKDGYILYPEEIFIGPGAYHPVCLKNGSFTLNTKNRVLGIPNESKTGVFIYYAKDISSNFNRWYINVLDGYTDGYAVKDYSIKVTTNGTFYDAKSNVNPQPATDSITSGTNNISYTISSPQIVQGITFVADNKHYIFDFGQPEGNSRFSIYKDESGYMNFRVIDKYNDVYLISSDISSWLPGQLHHVAASWALNTKTARDEMHLFIDGFEVPNIITYGSSVSSYLHEKFRTIDPEEIAGVISNAIVSSTDLITTIGSSLVSSSIDFTSYGIVAGGIIYIEEPGFNTSGYTILNVNGQTLTLNAVMPISSTNSSYVVNKTSFDVLTPIDLYPNIMVSLLHVFALGTDLQTTSNLNTVTSLSSNFNSINVAPGFLISINEPGFADTYTIVAVTGNTLTLSDPMIGSHSNATFYIYSPIEQEIPGPHALNPAYEIERDDNDEPILTILDLAQPNDIILIRTLGLNNRLIDETYYLWNGASNLGTVNTIMTRLPPPILLSDVNVTHILLDGYNIGPSNSTIIGNEFVSANIQTDQPSLSDNGRTLSIRIEGTNIAMQTDGYFVIPVTVNINGTINGISNQTETLTFLANGSLSTTSRFNIVNYFNVTCTPINSANNCVVIYIEELYPITTAENSITAPIIRYSYQMLSGNTLVGSGNTVTDSGTFFSAQTIGNYLVISSPSSAAGQYQILSTSEDHHSITISGSLPAFSNGQYQVLNVSTYRSGLQSGFLTFELAADGYVGQPYNLVQGFYRFKYYSYTSIQLDIDNAYGYIGSDMYGKNMFNGSIDELQTVSQKLTDTRIGETAAINQETITKDFNSLVALTARPSTIMLLHFDSFPFTNSANTYTNASNSYIQSASSVNGNFDQSICITNVPIIIDNTGILTAKQQGTIEFWVSPLNDTNNDPNYRYYFDATAMVSERVISTNNAEVSVSGNISSVVSVKVQVGNQSIDYFAGGTIDSDQQTVYLNRALPNQNTPVVINYIPVGTYGDRISIYKDPSGYINFDVSAAGIEYNIRAQTYWVKNTWHRLKASFIFNTGLGSDQIKFWIDGYEQGNISFGNGLLFGQGQVFGSAFSGQNTINTSIVFKDTVNELYIGSDYIGGNTAYALIDNLRISNISRPLFMPFGESIDYNYSINTDIVFPVTTDLYTTLLLDFNSLMTLNTNFSTIKNRKTGLFNFAINIYDQFGIVAGSAIVKQVLETLIDTLKPANSIAIIRYIE